MTYRPRSTERHALTLALLAALSSACAASAPPAGGGTPTAADEGINVEELHGAPAQRVEELLVGRFPGVRVFRLANGAITVQIRGASSVRGGNEPLYVLDGQPLADAPGGALMGIDPHDIARIEVLKDIGSISFYGVRGANGVVLITTKTGRKETRRLLPRDSYRYLHDVPSKGLEKDGLITSDICGPAESRGGPIPTGVNRPMS